MSWAEAVKLLPKSSAVASATVFIGFSIFNLLFIYSQAMLVILLLFRTVYGRRHLDDLALLVESESVDTNLTMDTWCPVAVHIVLVDAVIYDIPFIFARNLKD